MRRLLLLAAVSFIVTAGFSHAATTVPTNIQQPGTQPQEVGTLSSPDRCDNCHGGYNTATEPAFNWRGSMMANAGRDPIFWATLAVAEQDFDGAGDLCIRCHSTAGWLAGRSTPTDGSGLGQSDGDGVECDFCHKATNPDNSEHLGVMFPPFIANDGDNPGPGSEGYYGSGMASLWGGTDMLGPYIDAAARHQFIQSKFHRDRKFCGTCHDVSNPAVGNLAHNFGAQITAGSVIADGNPDPASPVDTKAAFNNPPYKYGIVERTFSEYMSSLVPFTLVDDYPNLPSDLQGGALQAMYDAATQNGALPSANYEDGDPRYYTCQTCHLRPILGQGCNKNPPLRNDLPLHDMTGGNYWMPEAIKYLDAQGKLRLGGGLTAVQLAALDAGALRAKEQLNLAGSLSVQGNTLKVVNHTGHKLISGYPEGRRMWLHVTWYAADGTTVLREDGAYGPIGVTLPNPAGGPAVAVESILDLHDPNTKIYEAHYGLDQEWAAQLVSLGWDANLPLSYDRSTGAVLHTLGELATQPAGTEFETFHFVLNNVVHKDNRIPPYGMSYDTARVRNALPVPAQQYGGGTAGSVYNYWDEFPLNPPQNASSASIELLYQPTSWEYIQFLDLANNGQNAFLAMEGAYMLEAWLNTGMAAPYVMASTTWKNGTQQCTAPTPSLMTATAGDAQVVLTWTDEHSGDANVTGYNVYYDQNGKAQLVRDAGLTTTYTDTGLTNGQTYCYKVTSYYDATCESGFSNIVCATPQNPGQTMNAGVSMMETGKYVTTGKGKTQTTTWTLTSSFVQGDLVTVRAYVVDDQNKPVANATVAIGISDPAAVNLTSGPSDAAGIAVATWQTSKPNKKGVGGTPLGSYTATTTNVTAAGYTWDGVRTTTLFTIQ